MTGAVRRLLWPDGFGEGTETDTRGRVCSPENSTLAIIRVPGETAAVTGIILQKKRRHLALMLFLHSVTQTLLVAGGLLVLWVFLSGSTAIAVSAAVMAALALLIAAGWTAWKLPDLPQTAQILDREARTADRFLTALRLRAEPGTMQAEAVRECEAFAERFDPAPFLKVRLPRALPYLLVPVVSVALLVLFQATSTPTVATAAPDPAAAEKIEQMEKLAQQLETQAPEDPEAAELAAQMRAAAERAAADPTDPGKAVLKELSLLEMAIRELALSRNAAAELAALAQALEQPPEAFEDPREAAEKLDELAAADPDLAEAQRRALEQALQRLAELQREAGRQTASQSTSAADAELMRQIAELLRQMPRDQKQQAQQGSRKQQSGQSQASLEQLLAALQNMKSGGEPSEGSGEEGAGVAPSGVQIRENPGDADSAIPSGRPGSERDTGTTADAFGAQGTPQRAEQEAGQLSGILGEGDSLQALLPALSEPGAQSERAYRELYEALAPAAEDAVTQEAIPLGSRFYIRRYFQSIRPRE